MTRAFVTIILPLLLPTAVYVLWALVTNRMRLVAPASSWQDLPWTWLVVTGVGLAAVVLVLFVQFTGSSEGTYVAPHIEEGHIVPGHVVPEPQPR
jgi:hypothetical protein